MTTTTGKPVLRPHAEQIYAAELAACPGPWPVSLAEVVVSMLRTVVTAAPGSLATQTWAGTRSGFCGSATTC